MLPSGGEVGGMPLDQIQAAFDAPFKPLAEGGCPPLKPPSSRQAAPVSSYMRHRAEMADAMWREASRPGA